MAEQYLSWFLPMTIRPLREPRDRTDAQMSRCRPDFRIQRPEVELMEMGGMVPFVSDRLKIEGSNY